MEAEWPVIGTMYRYWSAHQELASTDPQEAARKYGDPWVLTSQELMRLDMTEELIYAIASRAQRSGLI
jgi:hypothetical protein